MSEKTVVSCVELPSFHVVLVEPEIPPNTGNIGRLCLSVGARLHLIQPLGFSLDDKSLRRAGLDYWHELDWRLWPSLDDFFTAFASEFPESRKFFLTTKTKHAYWSMAFEKGDCLIFGWETRGLPETLLHAHPQECLTIPMPGPQARSLNLATSVGIVLYEAVRQVTMER
jgi:tRNA (cytidine/uridine-2'-O-)-methyltransferase